MLGGEWVIVEGAGGNVEAWEAGSYSLGTTTVTESLMNRGHDVMTVGFPGALILRSPYVENVGVRPDVTIDYMIPDNLYQSGRPFVDAFVKKYGQQPENYSITAYDAALVIIDAVKRVAEGGKEVNRANVRDAIQASKTKTLQGVVSFDDNGDITNREVSVFQIKKDDKHPLDSVLHQYKYLGVAPQSS